MRRRGGRGLRSEGEAAVAGEPGEGALDFPAVASQAFGGIDAASCDARRDPAFAQPAGRILLPPRRCHGDLLSWYDAPWLLDRGQRGLVPAAVTFSGASCYVPESLAQRITGLLASDSLGTATGLHNVKV
jgi:hypothetical protein